MLRADTEQLYYILHARQNRRRWYLRCLLCLHSSPLVLSSSLRCKRSKCVRFRNFMTRASGPPSTSSSRLTSNLTGTNTGTLKQRISIPKMKTSPSHRMLWITTSSISSPITTSATTTTATMRIGPWSIRLSSSTCTPQSTTSYSYNKMPSAALSCRKATPSLHGRGSVMSTLTHITAYRSVRFLRTCSREN